MTKLCAVAEPSPPDMARILGALRVNPDAEFLVAAVGRNDSLTVQRRLNLHAKRDERAFTFDQGHHTLIILQRRPANRPDLSFEENSLFDGIAAAVAPLPMVSPECAWP